MKQEKISALENPSRAPSLATLKKIANGLDIGLMVRFVAISDVVKWKGDMSENSLEARSYDDDPYFKEQTEDILNEAGMALKAPPQPQPLVYLIYDATRKKEPSIDELYASKQKERIAMMGVGR